MADITSTPARIAPVTETKPHMRFYRAGVAITRGQPCYLMTNGRIAPADASAAGTVGTFVGVALSTVDANEVTSVLWDGSLAGYTLTALNYGATVYISDTAGAFADAAGTVNKPVGVVLPLTDRDATKVLYIQARPF